MKVTVKMKPSVNHTRRRVDRDKQTDEQVTITKWKIDINLYLASRELLGKNQQTFHSPKRTKGPEISQLFGETYSYAPASAILNHVTTLTVSRKRGGSPFIPQQCTHSTGRAERRTDQSERGVSKKLCLTTAGGV